MGVSMIIYKQYVVIFLLAQRNMQIRIKVLSDKLGTQNKVRSPYGKISWQHIGSSEIVNQ